MSALAAYPNPPAPTGGLGRPALVLSLVLHVVAFVVVLGVPRLLASSAKAAPVYVVDLVSFGGGNPGPAAPPAAAPPAPAPPAAKKPAPEKPKVETPPPKPKKAPEKSIVIPDKNAKKTPPKETKKPAPQKPAPEPEPKSAADDDNAPDTGETSESAEPQPAAAAPAAGKSSAPGAPGGTPGGTGLGGQGTGVGGDAYNYYLMLLDRNIKGAWKRPLYNGQDVLSATVRMEISRSGRVLKLDLVTASGNDALDKSVLKAVRDAEPFPPLPTTLSLDTLPVQILFELNPQAGTGG